MDRAVFGDSVAGTLIRLVLLSVWSGSSSPPRHHPVNLIERLEILIRNVMNMGRAFYWPSIFRARRRHRVPIWFLVRSPQADTKA